MSHSVDQHPTVTPHSSPPSPPPPPPSLSSSDTDLSDEICLMRTVLDHLADDIPANHRDIVRTIGVLARVTSLCARRHHGPA